MPVTTALEQPEELRARIEGDIHLPGEPGYHELSQAWNRVFEHRPRLIVAPRTSADIAAAVLYARTAGLPVAVQATGHGVVRPADGALLISMHEMRDVVVDPDRWTASIAGGAKWQHVMDQTIPFGLAPLLGSTPDVGAVGYTLGGGMGWLARKYGLSADNVRSIEVVTADGQIRRVCPESDPDLFWALRGGGAGSLGVVTQIEVDLVPVASMYAGNLFYPARMAQEVAMRFRDWTRTAPDELTSAVTFMNFPIVDEIPPPMQGRSFVMVRGAFLGSDEDGERLLSYWRDWRAPEIDMWGRLPFADVATISSDPLEPLPAVGTTEWFDDLTPETISIITLALFGQTGGSPLMFAEFRHAGGAIARAPEQENSYGNRARTFVMEVVGVPETPEQLNEAEHFIAQLQQVLAPHVAGGAYLNFLEGDEKVRRSHEGFEPGAWERLRAVKTLHDPSNVFSHGIAIS